MVQQEVVLHGEAGRSAIRVADDVDALLSVPDREVRGKVVRYYWRIGRERRIQPRKREVGLVGPGTAHDLADPVLLLRAIARGRFEDDVRVGEVGDGRLVIQPVADDVGVGEQQ